MLNPLRSPSPTSSIRRRLAFAWLAIGTGCAEPTTALIRPGRDGGAADAPPGDGSPPCDRALPGSVLFIGNSFTFTGRMPEQVAQLLEEAGFDAPRIAMRTRGGETLEGHLADTSTDGAPARLREGWEMVILQEHSVRPTDSVGPAMQYKRDALALHELALTASPAAQVVLYQTFARHQDHPIYPRTFADPADMLTQVQRHVDDCAMRWIPTQTAFPEARPIVVARVGEAWSRVLATPDAPRLHGDDDYHPNANGAYLNALVFYAVISRRRSEGLPGHGIDPAVALRLQQAADAITGVERRAPRELCDAGSL